MIKSTMRRKRTSRWHLKSVWVFEMDIKYGGMQPPTHIIQRHSHSTFPTDQTFLFASTPSNTSARALNTNPTRTLDLLFANSS
jgi:hypothetical protein